MGNLNSALSRSLGNSPLALASREMDELFDRLFHPVVTNNGRRWAPPVSIWEEGDQFHLQMDLPGFTQEDLDVSFEDGHLSVAASRTRDENESRKYLHDERHWGEVRRVIPLPDSVNPESIEATYANGVLEVVLAKRAEVLPKKIEIKTK
ncbi:Hsp20/alpha crystallin family protein [Roseiconus lacunae]|uniref:Hsp20/alpha crystallin family protein n=1 Tax=Roseiconus lacunae TaxID=2605694 RepID=A0ABT7PBZ7_9BACT|nr:Hsp20/alpha crystallin family protein [Roseiconus lacunae]MCD0463554.1 Hsp20/alpha crystallin family protein [Roseiconus lacunae]MDM4013997.1 Hsp20/alpha crystallin family protein [Roseiconus lacunae]WRQ53291.1 Hsp20/alpha crystallin family protein [Stieleria sp. HD01]